MIRHILNTVCFIWITVGLVLAQQRNEFRTRKQNITAEEARVEQVVMSVMKQYVICPPQWTPGVVPGRGNVCLRLETSRRESWEDAQEVCRQDRGFLVNLLSDFRVGPFTVNKRMKDLGVRTFWTGMHVADSKLVWDERRPSVVQTTARQLEGLEKVNGKWTWNITTEDVEDSCGMVFLKDNKLTRKERSDGNARPLRRKQNLFDGNSRKIGENNRSSDRNKKRSEKKPRRFDGKNRRFNGSRQRIVGNSRRGSGNRRRFNGNKRPFRGSAKSSGGRSRWWNRRKRRSDGSKMSMVFPNLGDLEDHFNNQGDHDLPETTNPNLMFLPQMGSNSKATYITQFLKQQLEARKAIGNRQIMNGVRVSPTVTRVTVTTTTAKTSAENLSGITTTASSVKTDQTRTGETTTVFRTTSASENATSDSDSVEISDNSTNSQEGSLEDTDSDKNTTSTSTTTTSEISKPATSGSKSSTTVTSFTPSTSTYKTSTPSTSASTMPAPITSVSTTSKPITSLSETSPSTTSTSKISTSIKSSSHKISTSKMLTGSKTSVRFTRSHRTSRSVTYSSPSPSDNTPTVTTSPRAKPGPPTTSFTPSTLTTTASTTSTTKLTSFPDSGNKGKSESTVSRTNPELSTPTATSSTKQHIQRGPSSTAVATDSESAATTDYIKELTKRIGISKSPSSGTNSKTTITTTTSSNKYIQPGSFTTRVSINHVTAATTMDYLTELTERLAFTRLPVLPDEMEPMMTLEDCSEKHPFVCYKQPIRSLGETSLCGERWMGHTDIDRCYMVNSLPLPFHQAREHCIQEGGTMARVDSDFFKNISALALLYYRIAQRHDTVAWVDLQYTAGIMLNNCTYLDHFTVKTSSCDNLLPVVCEKNTLPNHEQDKFVSLFDDDDDDVEVRMMQSKRPEPLSCPFVISSPESEITWYKDGVAIPPSENRFGETVKDENLQLDSDMMKRLEQSHGGVFKMAMLQGVYWCQIWLNESFTAVKSNKSFVVFDDVVSLYGVVKTKGISLYDIILLNYMNTVTGIPLIISHGIESINDNVTRSLQRQYPALTEIDSVVKRIEPDTHEIVFYTYLTLKQVIPENMKTKLIQSYLKMFQSVLSVNDFIISRKWNVEQPIVNNINISRTDACSRAVLTDEVTGYRAWFPVTRVGQNTFSEETCDGVDHIGFAVCSGDYQNGAHWDSWSVTSECQLKGVSPTIPSEFQTILPEFYELPKKSFADLDEMTIDDTNVVEVSDKLADILEKTNELTGADIDVCAHVIERIVAVNPRSDQVGVPLVSSVNKILDVGGDAIEKAERNTKAASSIIGTMERFAMNSKLGNPGYFRIVSPNIAVEMWDLQQGMRPVIGLGASVSNDWSTPLTTPRIRTIVDRSDDMFLAFDVAIELPVKLVQDEITANTNSTRLSMVIYRKVSLFTSTIPMSNVSQDVINSAVIAASLGGKKIEGLKDKVRMIFRPFKKRNRHLHRTKCVFWDYSRGGWSGKGCFYNGSKHGKEICVCDHLTNFAILLDFYGNRMPIAPEHELSLSIITLVGLSLSILGLSLTIVSFIFFKKLRKGRAQLTLFNMALALVAANLVFLIGIKQTSNYVVCLLVSILLHYLILVAFMWMLIEAVLQYFTFVKVLGSYISRYSTKTLISAWGLPLIPVTILLSVDYDLYRGRRNYCWLDLEAFYFAFALPVGIIITINIVMFVVVLVSIIRRPDGLRNNQSKHKRASTNLKAAITVFVLLGLTWAFGYLAIDDARLIFQYIFTSLSSLQGFFIFVLMVARRPKVREQWRAVCCKTSEKDGRTKTVSPTMSNSASSRGSDASSRSSDAGTRGKGSTRTLVGSISVSSTCSSGSCFAANSFVNRAFNDGFDSVYNVHSRRNSAPYANLQNKPCDSFKK